MQFKDNIDCEKNYNERMIRICEMYPENEDMLMMKAKCLKRLERTYKFLECLETVLKINPHNINAIIEIAAFLGDRNV